MKKRTKQQISKVVSPIAIAMLKLHTKLTGAERARMIVRNEYGELLLVLGLIGETWTFPGGGINRGERALDAAIRELYEETGMSVSESAVSHVVTIDSSQSHAGYTAHLFQTVVNKALLPSTPHNRHEIIEIVWVKDDCLPEPLSPLVRTGLDSLSKM